MTKYKKDHAINELVGMSCELTRCAAELHVDTGEVKCWI